MHGCLLSFSLSAGVGKGLTNHFEISSLVNPYVFAAITLYLVILGCKGIFFGNSCFVAPQNFPGADLVILPQFVFTGSTAKDQHSYTRS